MYAVNAESGFRHACIDPLPEYVRTTLRRLSQNCMPSEGKLYPLRRAFIIASGSEGFTDKVLLERKTPKKKEGEGYSFLR